MTTCAVCGRAFDQERHSYETVCEDCQFKAAVSEMTVDQALENVRRGCGGQAEADVLGRELARLGKMERTMWQLISVPEEEMGGLATSLVSLLTGSATQAQKRSYSAPEGKG